MTAKARERASSKRRNDAARKCADASPVAVIEHAASDSRNELGKSLATWPDPGKHDIAAVAAAVAAVDDADYEAQMSRVRAAADTNLSQAIANSTPEWCAAVVDAVMFRWKLREILRRDHSYQRTDIPDRRVVRKLHRVLGRVCQQHVGTHAAYTVGRQDGVEVGHAAARELVGTAGKYSTCGTRPRTARRPSCVPVRSRSAAV